MSTTHKKESNILKLILMAATEIGTRLFRVNVGMGWTGNKIDKVAKDGMYYCSKGDVIIRDAHPFSSGLPKGYSDTTGWTPVNITQDMVGKKIAVFTAIEAKAPTGRVSSHQKNFLEAVSSAGGIAFVARSGEEFCNEMETQKDLLSRPLSADSSNNNN